jgi:hypothetical protein
VISIGFLANQKCFGLRQRQLRHISMHTVAIVAVAARYPFGLQLRLLRSHPGLSPIGKKVRTLS